MSLAPVATLDELAAHPERASEIPPATAGALLARLAGIQTALLALLDAIRIAVSSAGRNAMPSPSAWGGGSVLPQAGCCGDHPRLSVGERRWPARDADGGRLGGGRLGEGARECLLSGLVVDAEGMRGPGARGGYRDME